MLTELPAGPSAAAIREALARILAGKEFRSSHRCQEFLRFVVETTLSGHADTLKERVIGIEAFGRPAAYEPADDASVRVKASEVRRRLSAYYSLEGGADPVRIGLPTGGYIPAFSFAATNAAPPGPTLEPNNGTPPTSASPSSLRSAPPPAPGAPAWRRWRWILALAIAASALAAGWLEWRREARPEGAMRAFWAPLLAGPAPVLIGASYVPVYGPRSLTALSASRMDQLIRLPDQFVGGGDLIAVSRVVGLMSRWRQPYRLEVGKQVTFTDMKNSPAVLVGYAYTQWSSIASGFRYFISIAKPPFGITDRGRPTPWQLPRLGPDRHTSVDYAILTRVLDPATNGMLIEVAGITQYGTAGAAEFATNPAQMAAALAGAPRGWAKQNVQIVLRVSVIAGSPAEETVEARYYWPR
ncbi:MAG: hypothetical protein ACRD13_02185 [Terriglobales bacterium]